MTEPSNHRAPDDRDEGLRRTRSCLTCGAAAFIVVLLLVGIAVTVALNRYGFRADAGWIDTERKKVEPLVKPTVVDNGYDYYAAAAARIKFDPLTMPGDSLEKALEEYRAGTIPLADIRSLLDANEHVFALIHQAADKDYASPAKYSVSDVFPWSSEHRKLARLVAADIAALHEEGRDAEALERARDGFSLGVNVTQYGALIESLIGAAVVSIIDEASKRVVESERLTSQDLKAHATQVRAIRSRRPGPGVWLQAEFLAVVEAVDEIARNPSSLEHVERMAGGSSTPPPPGDSIRWRLYAMTWDPEASLEWMEDRYARLIEAAGAPPIDGVMAALEARTEADLDARNDAVASVMFPVFDLATGKNTDVALKLIAQELQAAIRAYHLERGRYPLALEDLVPEYLPDVPLHPMTGAPFTYGANLEGFSLQSFEDDSCAPRPPS